MTTCRCNRTISTSHCFVINPVVVYSLYPEKKTVSDRHIWQNRFFHHLRDEPSELLMICLIRILRLAWLTPDWLTPYPSPISLGLLPPAVPWRVACLSETCLWFCQQTRCCLKSLNVKAQPGNFHTPDPSTSEQIYDRSSWRQSALYQNSWEWNLLETNWTISAQPTLKPFIDVEISPINYCRLYQLSTLL